MRNINIHSGNNNEYVGGDYYDQRIINNHETTKSFTIRKPFQAPPKPEYYVDRPEVSRDLKQRLLSNGGTLVISAIHGLGSVGKSTLAAALAHDPEIQNHFCDGILWTTLGQELNVSSELQRWVHALEGDQSYHVTSIEATVAHLRTLLYDKAALLVVDDVWDSDKAQHFQVGGSRCQVLVTTRDDSIAHVLGASIYNLDVMTSEQAMELLTKKLKQENRELLETERQTAANLAKAVGYLPLALELATAQVARGISFQVLLEDITKEIARLKSFDLPLGKDVKDKASIKKHSLQASLNLSVKQLFEDERENFIWLGVLQEDATITTKMAVTLWDMEDERAAGDRLRDFRSQALLLSNVALTDDTPTYRLHDLFHDLARNLLTAPKEPKRNGDLPGLGLELVDARVTFLDKYRKKTENGQWHTLPDDGYIHQRLVWHLEKAGKTEEVHQLLQEETLKERNGWYEACDRLGQTGNFVTDVARAWELAEKMFEENPSKSIALQCRYALIVTSLNSLARNIPSRLMAALVEQKLWTPAQGLAYAQQVKESEQRAKALSALAPHLPKSLLAIALDTALRIQDKYLAYALKGLAPYLPPEMLQDALKAARSIQNCEYCSDALVRLAGYLPPKLLRQALEVARSIKDNTHRALALSGLVPYLPEIRQEALKAARSIQYDNYRSLALGKLVPYLPKQDLRKISLKASFLRVLRVLCGSFFRYYCVSPTKIRQEALETARNIQDDHNRAYALVRLVPYLPEIRQEAFEAACRIQHSWYLGDALSKLAPHLPPELLHEAFNAICSIKKDTDLGYALSELAPYLPQQLLHKALKITFRIQDDYRRFSALSALTPHLPPELLQEALNATRNIQNDYYRAKALCGLAPHQPELLQEAFEVTRSIQDDYYRAKALCGLAPYQPEILQEALNATRSIQDDYYRAKALLGLVPHQPELLQEAFEVTRRIQDDDKRAKALCGLAPYQPEILKEALDATRSIQDDHDRAKALCGLVPHLPPELLQNALEVARSIQYLLYRTEVLGRLAPHLPPELLQQAVNTAHSIENIFERFSALSALTPHLPPELLQEVLEAARSFEHLNSIIDYIELSTVLSGLAPHLPEIQQEALEVALRFLFFPYGAAHLRELAPHLPPELLQQALDKVLSLPYNVDLDRVGALCALAPHLPPELLQQALEAARSIQNESDRAYCFSSLLSVLNLTSIKFDFWCEILRNLSHHQRAALLEDIPKLSDAIIALGGTDALVATVRAIQQVCRQWR